MDRLKAMEGHQMVIRKALLAAAAVGMVVGSTTAMAAPAARTASPVGETEGLAGAGFAWIIAALIAAGVVAIVVTDDDEDLPTSP